MDSAKKPFMTQKKELPSSKLAKSINLPQIRGLVEQVELQQVSATGFIQKKCMLNYHNPEHQKSLESA